MASVSSFKDCISPEESKAKLSLYLLNAIVVLVLIGVTISSMGTALLFIVPGILFSWIFGGYVLRLVRAGGVTVSAQQFPKIHAEAEAIRRQFGLVNDETKIVILPHSALNALAIRFGNKKAVILFTDMVDAVIDNPLQLRALLAHEFCHVVLDHGFPGRLFFFKSAQFTSGRELTCDRAALAAAGSVEETKFLLKKLYAGKRLWESVNEQALKDETAELYSGFFGWLLKRKLTHPPAGKRLINVEEFAAEQGIR